jgi:hypothetical protein
MKNPFKYLIPAYYNALNGQVVVNGTTLPVYDGIVPPNGAASYILIGERTSSQQQAKCGFLTECFVLIDVVLKGNNYGYKAVEDAADQILGIINSDDNVSPSSGIQVVTTSVQSINNLSGLNATDQVFRQLIRFRNVVSQI